MKMYQWLYAYWLSFQPKEEKPKSLPSLTEVITHQQHKDYSKDVVIEVRGGFVSSSPEKDLENIPT